MSKSNGNVDTTLDAGQFLNLDAGLVNRRIFVDEDVYRAELKQIFGRCWLYLAHEAEIPNPGDYVTVNMGEAPVIVCRGRDGKINAFMNSCRHRGNILCRADKGNARTFVCPYHGWGYDTSGKLVGVPGMKDYYYESLDRSQWGLPKVAQVDSYRGLIFGTLDPEAPSLEEYLGDIRWGIDMLMNQGDLAPVSGIVRWNMECNWKFASDNAIGDMYHGPTTHRSGIMAGHKGGAGTMTEGQGTGGLMQALPMFRPENGMTLITEYGHGLNATYIDQKMLDSSSPLSAWRRDPAIIERMGPKRMQLQRGNFLIFPNLFVNFGSRELMLRNPMGPNGIEIWKTTLVDRNLPPEAQREQVRNSNRHFGPAGVFEQDDGENWEYSTKGCFGEWAQQYDIHYAMGLGHNPIIRGEEGAAPYIPSQMNEHAQLWMYKVWAEYLNAASWPQLRETHSRVPEKV